MAQKFAVFDIDGTVARTSLFLQTIDQLILDDHLPREYRIRLDAKLERYRNREHADAFYDYLKTSVDLLFGSLQHIKVADYRQAVDTVIEKTKQYSYVYTRNLIKSLKEQGYFLIALSGSEMYAVEQFTAHYGFDVAIGELYEESDGIFTGLADKVAHSKDVYLQQLIKKHGLDMQGSIAVGDTKGDAAMLELVEQPIAFNPEENLFVHAKEQDWKIVVERKNVIYELQPGTQKGDDGTYVLA